MAQDEDERGPTETSAPIGFGNSQALRSAYPAALLAAVLGNIPFLHLLCFIWYPGAGFLTVHNYRKRTGSYPSVSGGAKLGSMTGVFTFVITMVMLAVVMLFASDSADLAEAIRQQIDQMPGQPDVKRQMREIIRNPTVIAFAFVLYLGVSFLITVGLTALGGALGAKVLEKD